VNKSAKPCLYILSAALNSPFVIFAAQAEGKAHKIYLNCIQPVCNLKLNIPQLGLDVNIKKEKVVSTRFLNARDK